MASDSGSHPTRGEVYWVDFEQPTGHRPAVVVSNNIGNQYGSVVIVAIMTRTIPAKAYPHMVYVPAGKPLPHEGMIHCGQLYTIARTRLEDHAGQLDGQRLAELDTALRVSLAL